MVRLGVRCKFVISGGYTKMNFNNTKIIFSAMMLASILLPVSGCGGGGGGSSATPDTTPPTVSSTNHANNATNVAVNSAVTATFSEAMSAATITTATFALNNGATGTVTYTGTTATFTPTGNLAYSTAYTATITTGAKDNAGNAMAADYTWSFTTDSPPSAPTGVTAVAGDAQVAVSWNAVAGGASYNIYWSTVSGTGTAGTQIAGAVSPYVHAGRANGTPHYYVVTAVTGGGEGPASVEASATPVAAVSTTRVSVDSAGAQANLGSTDSSISSDGRYVAFYSGASTLVAGDTNGTNDVFVRDTVANTITRVSVSSAGAQGNGNSWAPFISADGRYVAFKSTDTNLVAGDTNGRNDIFVRDTVTNTTSRVSMSSAGAEANGDSSDSSISSDGRYVAFDSGASNLVAGDTNAWWDVFVRDTVTNTTTRVSVSTAGAQGTGGGASLPSISGDGRYVAFVSSHTDHVAGDTNGAIDIFVRDTVANTTTRVSVDSAGTQGNGTSYASSISTDGRYVAFYSGASNLVAGDTNGVIDIFVRDTVTNTTSRVSVDSAGAQGNDASLDPSISADGRYVAFYSVATNLVAGDTNGFADVFVRDTVTNTTTRVSVSTVGAQGIDGDASLPSISADGRYVAFTSSHTNHVAGDTNAALDVFVRKRW